ncbi:RagB/SusD family nutrient uptake outer membrane protein [soil metagenome]
MKKIYLIIAIVLAGAASCKKQTFLDDKTSSLIDVNAVFSDSARTMAFLSRMYEEIPFAFNYDRWEGGNTIQGTDDGESNLGNPARRSVALYLANYSAENVQFYDAWDTPWNNIRRANLLLSRLATTPLSPILQNRVKGEAKFMRAYFYGYLLVNYGGMPLIGETLYDKDANINLPRATFDETLQYIVKELDEAAALLPIPNSGYNPSVPAGQSGYQDADYGRVTKGACMAIKARMLLYAASPLFNGGFLAGATEDQKKVAGYPTNDAARWQSAADAALAVINSGYYALNVENNVKPGFGFYNVFLKRVNSEYILFTNRGANKDFENVMLPPSRGASNQRLKPSQNLVECFPMKNGKMITDPTSGYDHTNPYVNRDPRFNYSIIFNGSRYQKANTGVDSVFTWSVKATATNIANTTGDGYNPDAAAPATPNTGYFDRKMCDSNIANNSGANTNRGWPLLRYAEIVLSYAEAMNELGQTEMAVDKIKDIRNRAGIDAGTDGRYGINAGISQADMRDLIRNERHIELFAEGDNRWDDIRRWKIAVAVNNGLLRGVMIERNPVTKLFTYNTSVVGFQAHVFAPKQYLFPIPGIEIRKMPLMIQNPGW